MDPVDVVYLVKKRGWSIAQIAKDAGVRRAKLVRCASPALYRRRKGDPRLFEDARTRNLANPVRRGTVAVWCGAAPVRSGATPHEPVPIRTRDQRRREPGGSRPPRRPDGRFCRPKATDASGLMKKSSRGWPRNAERCPPRTVWTSAISASVNSSPQASQPCSVSGAT